LYLDLPGVALTVGVVGAHAARRGRLAGAAVAAALAAYACVSVALLVIVLSYVERVNTELGYGRPLRFGVWAAEAARAALPANGYVIIEGTPWAMQAVRFAIGYDVQARITADPCGEPPGAANTVYVLTRDRPGLEQSQIVARIDHPGGVYLVATDCGPPPARSERSAA
ncbi:MAG: hypothetical protein M3336_05340, partial [Chloroflexota bacterium]|nr:hypothetical protein [Chloroflexota bacterium]